MELSNTKFNVGDTVVLTEPLDGFHKDTHYIIEKIFTVDYFIDEVDPNFGNTCVFFTGLKRGCYLEDLDKNFKKLDELRNTKLDKLINL